MSKKKLTKKEATLKYLQNEAITIRNQVPNLIDAVCEDDKLVLLVSNAIEVPELTYEGVKLAVEVRLTNIEVKPVAELSEAARKANEIRKRHGVVPVESLHIPSATPAIGPDGSGERRSANSYDNWKKRFNK